MTLAEQVMEYAEAHYNDAFSWSQIVECQTIDELAIELEELGIATLERAKQFYGVTMEDVYQDRLADAQFHRSQA